MPIFEYECKSCGADFEELVFHSEDIPKCPACMSDRVEKKVSKVASFGSSGSDSGYAPSSYGGCTSFG